MLIFWTQLCELPCLLELELSVSIGKKFPVEEVFTKVRKLHIEMIILLFSGRLYVLCACMPVTLSIPLNYAYKSPSTCQFLHARSGYAKLILHP
jgi:hypothetical protein